MKSKDSFTRREISKHFQTLVVLLLHQYQKFPFFFQFFAFTRPEQLKSSLFTSCSKEGRKSECCTLNLRYNRVIRKVKIFTGNDRYELWKLLLISAASALSQQRSSETELMFFGSTTIRTKGEFGPKTRS